MANAYVQSLLMSAVEDCLRSGYITSAHAALLRQRAKNPQIRFTNKMVKKFGAYFIGEHLRVARIHRCTREVKKWVEGLGYRTYWSNKRCMSGDKTLRIAKPQRQKKD